MSAASRIHPRIRRLSAVRPHVAFLGALVGAVGLATACSSSSGEGVGNESSADTLAPSATCREPAGCIRSDRVQIIGRTSYGATTDGVNYTGTPKYDALRFNGVTGDSVNVLVHSSTGGAYVWLLDSEFGILAFSNNDPTGATSDARIQMVLPSTGSMKYFVGFRTQSTSPATFTVTLDGPPNLTYASTRIQQTDVDNGVYSADQLFAFGHVMFGNQFTVDEGLGNALLPPLAGPNPRPNARQIHNGKFGGPDSNNCIGCHNVGGADGGGTLAKNLLQDGDGVNLSSALVRNAPALLGDGYIQQLGIEMTADLQAQLKAAKSAAPAAGAQTVALASKGVSFGTIVVGTDGTVDFTGLDGVDADLVVKPLGWKGRTALLRRFVEGGFQVHFGMASQALVAQNCKTPIPNVVGNGPDCTDPDSDGVRDEILEGQLTSMALYPALLQAPIRIPPTDPTALSRTRNGESLFGQVGCTSCHVQSLALGNPVHLESPDLSGGAPFSTDLTVDGKLPRLSPQGDGSVVVELWSDLKRHDMGASLADAHDTFGVIAPQLFMTRPLWGVGVTAPYLHDGRAATLQDAIAQHDGEAASVRDAFLALDTDSQAQVVEFLQTLSRDPRHTDD
jgi:hypothetical protein